MTEELARATFDAWWNRNHPLDWFAKDRKGNPLPTFDRLLVYEYCKKTWIAAKLESL